MPKLPEVEAMLDRIAPSIIGRHLLAFESLTPHARKLVHGAITVLHKGNTLIDVTRHGKVSLLHFYSAIVAVQLGMSGRLIFRQPLERQRLTAESQKF